MIESAMKQLNQLPEEYQRFYKKRIISNIQKTL